ncbi:MAG TPA: protein kinase [Ktedonobacteraceae bacterium]
MSDLLEGAMLSEYLLLQCISRGGIADVYRARQTGEGNYEVAVKVFRPGFAQRESFREYFMAEAEKIGQFEHPNILPFLEFGEGEGLLYSVTPFVTTGTLEDLLRRVGGKFSAMQALPIIQQLCSAVQYAHDRNVIHGNIKPTNVFVAADGRMLLSDFGIVRGYDDSQQSLTRVGWGSAEYAAPEQSLGVLRRASDIYSLGVLLFRILTGQPPFTGHTPVEVLLKHVRQQAPSARSLDANISDAVDGVLHMALQKRSDDRFASAEEFSNALAAAVSVAPVASPVAKSVTPVAHQLAPNQSSTLGGDPQTPMPAYVALSSALSPTPPAIPTGQSNAAPPVFERSYNQTSPVSTPPEGPKDSEITMARKTNFLQAHEHSGTPVFWSTEPVEWSPIGNETVGTMPSTAREYLRSKSTPLETPADIPSPTVQPTSGEEKQKGHQDSNARLKKLLPILVVILLLIGLIAALLSSFFFPGPSSGANTGAEQLVVGVSSMTGNAVALVTNASIGPLQAISTDKIADWLQVNGEQHQLFMRG